MTDPKLEQQARRLEPILRDIAAGRKNAVGDRWGIHHCGEAADLIAALSQQRAVPEGWIPISDRSPPRNEMVVYWHASKHGGFPAIADEWRDEHHAEYATHWHPGASAAPSPEQEAGT